MRWYCLHPDLPAKAVLRIRTAPSSNASVCGRVSKGKAIAVCAPEFEIADDQLQQSSPPSSSNSPTLQRWLHVAFPDEFSGETTEGYVMASLADGTSLLVPWEHAGTSSNHPSFLSCHRVREWNWCYVLTKMLASLLYLNARFYQLLSRSE